MLFRFTIQVANCYFAFTHADLLIRCLIICAWSIICLFELEKKRNDVLGFASKLFVCYLRFPTHGIAHDVRLVLLRDTIIFDSSTSWPAKLCIPNSDSLYIIL